MIPGPVPLSPACASELARPVEAHYGPAWAAIHHETVGLLREALGTTTADVLLLVGSGSTGLDAAIGSLVDAGSGVVVGVNGSFGERLAAMARGHGAQVTEVEARWGEPIDPAALDAALSRVRQPAAVIVTHVETSTGVVNPIDALAATAHGHDVPILVDAVSSAGGMEVAMDRIGIDVCVTASQKCLGGPTGLAPVAVSASGWRAIERRRAARGWYMDLRTWRDFATREASWHPTPVSMPTNAVRALRQGLIELQDEGVPARAARFRRLAARLRAGLRALGVPPLADEGWAAPVVTAARSLPGVDSGDVVRAVERTHGIRIAGGPVGPLAGTLFRVGHLAPGTSEHDIDDVLGAIGSFLASVDARRGGAQGRCRAGGTVTLRAHARGRRAAAAGPRHPRDRRRRGPRLGTPDPRERHPAGAGSGEIIGLDEVPDDATVVCAGMMGSVKAIEAIGFAALLERWEEDFPLLTVVRAMEGLLGRRVDAVIPFEAGGLNSPVVLTLAARMGIAAIDADALGRSAPETHMTSWHGHGVAITPMPLADSDGQHRHRRARRASPRTWTRSAASSSAEAGTWERTAITR